MAHDTLGRLHSTAAAVGLVSELVRIAHPLRVVGRGARGERARQGLDAVALELHVVVPALERIAVARSGRHRRVLDGLVGLAGHVLDLGAAVLDEHDEGLLRHKLNRNSRSARDVVHKPAAAVLIRAHILPRTSGFGLAIKSLGNRVTRGLDLDLVPLRDIDIKIEVGAVQIVVGVVNLVDVAICPSGKACRAPAFFFASDVSRECNIVGRLYLAVVFHDLNSDRAAIKDDLLPLGIERRGSLGRKRELVAFGIGRAVPVRICVPAAELIFVPTEAAVILDRYLVTNIPTLGIRCLAGNIAGIQIILKGSGLMRVVEVDDVLTVLGNPNRLVIRTRERVIRNIDLVIFRTLRCANAHREGVGLDNLLIGFRIDVINRQGCKTACIKRTVKMPRANRVFLRSGSDVVVRAILDMQLGPRNLIEILEQRRVREIRREFPQGGLNLLHVSWIVKVDLLILASVGIAKRSRNEHNAEGVPTLIVENQAFLVLIRAVDLRVHIHGHHILDRHPVSRVGRITDNGPANSRSPAGEIVSLLRRRIQVGALGPKLRAELTLVRAFTKAVVTAPLPAIKASERDGAHHRRDPHGNSPGCTSRVSRNDVCGTLGNARNMPGVLVDARNTRVAGAPGDRTLRASGMSGGIGASLDGRVVNCHLEGAVYLNGKGLFTVAPAIKIVTAVPVGMSDSRLAS